ncbi:MAG: hypothetical protein M3137_20185 [Actinomycetota bacterium]|nr:hypothetical protein [Actinomycetota bacterium]
MASKDEVRLVVPARPELLRLARVTAAGLASRLGFSFDEVEDLRLAIDELCYGLTGPEGRPGMVEIRYDLAPERLIIEGEGDFGEDTKPVALSELSEVMLSALVDEHSLETGPTGPRFRMVKRAQSPRRAMLNGTDETS